MTSEPIRDLLDGHLLTPMNSEPIILDYRPLQTVHPNLCISPVHTKEAMSLCGSQDETSESLIAPAATDEILVGAAKLGDRHAFAELWQRHSNAVFRVACRITKNQDDAEDVLQEAWMKAYVHLKTFDGRAKFSTWLTRIVINSALMTLRRKRTHPEASMEITDGETWQLREVADEATDVDELYIRYERTESLRRAICRLKPSLRSVIEIHQSNDSSVKEIAELTGLTVTATKSRLLRARAVLRSDLLEGQRSNAALLEKNIDEYSIRPGRRHCMPSRYRPQEIGIDGISTMDCEIIGHDLVVALDYVESRVDSLIGWDLQTSWLHLIRMVRVVENGLARDVRRASARAVPVKQLV